jgi:prevent-host-death family protein
MTIVIDFGEEPMKQMPAGVFKTHCLTIMKEVQATREPVVITKRGKPVVKVMPVEAQTENLLGFMKGKVKVVGDIESPIPVEWKVMKA